MCIDYCAVNCITKKDRYSLPNIEELVQPLGGSSYLLKIDWASGYLQNRICAGHRHKTAFSMKYSLYKWTVIPFGLAKAQQIKCAATMILSSPPFAHGGLCSSGHMIPWSQMPISSTKICLRVLTPSHIMNFACSVPGGWSWLGLDRFPPHRLYGPLGPNSPGQTLKRVLLYP